MLGSEGFVDDSEQCKWHHGLLFDSGNWDAAHSVTEALASAQK